MLLFVQEAIARGKNSALAREWRALMGETEAAVAKAIKDFEERAARGDFLKMADYTRLLDGASETLVKPLAQMILRWADTWEQTTPKNQ